MNDLRGLATVFCFVAFLAIVWWAYGPSRKGYFDKAAQIPFEDEVDGAGGEHSREKEQ